MQLLPINARGSVEEIERGFATMAKSRAQAVIVTTDAFNNAHQQRVIQLTAAHRIPSIHSNAQAVEAGGLMSYYQNAFYQYRRAAVFVDTT